MSIISRKQKPYEYKNYSFFKKYLRPEFNYECAYCKMNEPRQGGSKHFDIDHYKPKDKFPMLINKYHNLFYSCKDCNILKKDFWPNLLDILFGQYILNPCDHDFEEHYDTKETCWKAKSSVAAWNILTLKLNSRRNQDFRNDKLTFTNMIQDLQQEKSKYISYLENPELSIDLKNKYELLINQINAKINSLNRTMFDPLD